MVLRTPRTCGPHGSIGGGWLFTMKKTFVLLAALLSVCMGVSQATPVFDPILGIVSTGAGLADGATDVNFLLISAPAGVPLGISPKVVKTMIDYGAGSQSAFPFWHDTWVPNTANSQWVGIQDSYSAPTRDGYGPADPGGWYTFRMTFVLPSSFAAQHATIAGAWAADDRGQIYLNGVEQSSCGATGAPCFRAMQAFDINSGFVAGINYLDFSVYNNFQEHGNPTGFRVDFSGANYMVPEPSTFVLWAGGLAGLALLRRRKTA